MSQPCLQMLVPPSYKTIYVKQGRLTITIHYHKITPQEYQVFSGSPAFLSIMGTRDCIISVFQELKEERGPSDHSERSGRRQALITGICDAIKSDVLNAIVMKGKGPRFGNKW